MGFLFYGPALTELDCKLQMSSFSEQGLSFPYKDAFLTVFYGI